jgi:alkylation response protein AidB-like acyl-CoA dehydrogenase
VTSPVAEADVIARAETLLRDNARADERDFLGAQFDLGLAWVHHAPGAGGLGAAPKLQELVDERLEGAGRRYPWMRNPMGIGMVGPAIAQLGRPDQVARYLRPLFTAEEMWCQLFSEPGAGSDVATLATRAVLDGDEWVVNGQKVWTSNAHVAAFGLLLARTNPEAPKHRGITAFLIDMHAPGIEVRPLRMISGSAHFNEVYFTDTRIPDSCRIGDVNDGWRVAVATLMNERVSIGGTVEPRGSGPIAGALSVYGRSDRTTAARDVLMRLWSEAEVNRLGNLRAQQLREAGTPGPEGAVLKLAGALLSQRIASFTMDLLGADAMLHRYEFSNDAEASLTGSFLGVQSTTIAGGTSEIMRNILGERMLGLPAEPRADKDVAWSQIPK